MRHAAANGPAIGTPRELCATLDAIAAGVHDLPGVWESWSRLILVSRDTLDRHGRDGLAMLRDHPVAAISRQCPLTNWAWRQPRGYPDDARLADFLYGHESVEDSVAAASTRGQDIFAFARQSGLAEAVRERRAILARLVDATAERVEEAEVLALGAQHLREASLARHAADLHRWVALDRDPETVDEIAASYAGLDCLRPVAASLERTMLHPLEFGQFDLIYAATACEYLGDRELARLLGGMVRALKPGGRALLASFVPGLPEDAYMSAYMDWRPLRRDEAALRGLLDQIPDAACARRTTFHGANGRIVYGMVQRPA